MNNEQLEQHILTTLDNQLDGFIVPNQSEFCGIDTRKLFETIYSLIDKGILQKRNCVGLAYEYTTNKAAK